MHSSNVLLTDDEKTLLVNIPKLSSDELKDPELSRKVDDLIQKISPLMDDAKADNKEIIAMLSLASKHLEELRDQQKLFAVQQNTASIMAEIQKAAQRQALAQAQASRAKAQADMQKRYQVITPPPVSHRVQAPLTEAQTTLNLIQTGLQEIIAHDTKEAGQRKKIITAIETNEKELAAEILADKSEKFTPELMERFGRFSNVTPRLIEVATRVSARIKDNNEYTDLLNYFIQQGPSGREIAEKIIENSIKASATKGADPQISGLGTKAAEARLDRNLMMAAKLGNEKLYDQARTAGAELIRMDTRTHVLSTSDFPGAKALSKAEHKIKALLGIPETRVITPDSQFIANSDLGKHKLVIDPDGNNILTYACRSTNENLVYKIAEEMRGLAEKQKFIVPADSTVDGEFNPFYIRSDKSLSQHSILPTYHVNEQCAIHQVSPELAAKLDVKYKLSKDVAKGTFKAAAAYNLLDNKVTEGSFLIGKMGKHGESLEKAAYFGKFSAGTLVANVSANMDLVMNTISSGVFIGGLAAIGGGVLAMRHMHNRSKAMQYTGASEKASLSSKPNASVYKQNDNSNYNIEEALKRRDFNKLTKIIDNPALFKKTTNELITLVRQILNFDENFNKEKFFSVLAKKCGGEKEFNKLMDVLYSREENQLAIKILKNMDRTTHAAAKKEWSEKFMLQENPGPVQRFKEHDTSKEGQEELEKAFETFDFYKIQHIVKHGNFNHTSKEILKALKEMGVFPLSALPSAAGKPDETKIFMQTVYEGLAKKAGPNELNTLLTDWVENIGSKKIGNDIVKNLLAEYSRDSTPETRQADKERLKVCALMAARMGSMENLKTAIEALKTHHENFSIMDITDKHNNNVLHYAAMSQDGEMMQRILRETRITNDFAAKDKTTKDEKVLAGLITIDTARNVMQQRNTNGETPAKMLHSKEANAAIDNALLTSGFGITSNEKFYSEDKARRDNLNLAANLTVAGTVVAFCTGLGIPLAVAGGTFVGAHLAALTVHIFKSISFGGGLAEGAFACGMAHETEKNIMPAVRELFQSFGKLWNSAQNNSYMRVSPDYEDRLISKHDELMTSIANRIALSDQTPEAIGLIFKEESQRLVQGESDETMRFIAELACQKALGEIVGSIEKNIDDPNKYLQFITDEANAIDKKNDISIEERTLFILKEKYAVDLNKANQGNRLTTAKGDIERMHGVLNDTVDTLARLKEFYVSKTEIEMAKTQAADPNISEKDLFIAAATIRADATLQRQIKQAETKLDKDKLIGEFKQDYARKIIHINDLATTYENTVNYRQEQIYTRLESASIQKDFLASLNKLDGGATGWKNEADRSVQIWSKGKIFDEMRLNRWGQDGPLSKAAKEVFKTKPDAKPAELEQLLKEALIKAYSDVRHPDPSKALEMMRSVATFTDRSNNIKLSADLQATPPLGKPPLIAIVINPAQELCDAYADFTKSTFKAKSDNEKLVSSMKELHQAQAALNDLSRGLPSQELREQAVAKVLENNPCLSPAAFAKNINELAEFISSLEKKSPNSMSEMVAILDNIDDARKIQDIYIKINAGATLHAQLVASHPNVLEPAIPGNTLSISIPEDGPDLAIPTISEPERNVTPVITVTPSNPSLTLKRSGQSLETRDHLSPSHFATEDPKIIQAVIVPYLNTLIDQHKNNATARAMLLALHLVTPESRTSNKPAAIAKEWLGLLGRDNIVLQAKEVKIPEGITRVLNNFLPANEKGLTPGLEGIYLVDQSQTQISVKKAFAHDQHDISISGFHPESTEEERLKATHHALDMYIQGNSTNTPLMVGGTEEQIKQIQIMCIAYNIPHIPKNPSIDPDRAVRFCQDNKLDLPSLPKANIDITLTAACTPAIQELARRINKGTIDLSVLAGAVAQIDPRAPKPVEQQQQQQQSLRH